MRRATQTAGAGKLTTEFQSTLSMRRATQGLDAGFQGKVFQSTLSMRRATGTGYLTTDATKFQSTLSMRRATKGVFAGAGTWLLFQSTLSMRRATLFSLFIGSQLIISIHALHEESDSNSDFLMLLSQFQSTLSMRRATVQLDIFVRFLRRKPAA